MLHMSRYPSCDQTRERTGRRLLNQLSRGLLRGETQRIQRLGLLVKANNDSKMKTQRTVCKLPVLPRESKMPRVAMVFL